MLSVEKHVDGMEITGRDQGLNCETCVLGKMVNLRNKQPDARAEKPLELVHLDLAGPIEPVALNGYRYSLVCVDDFSNLTIVYFLRQKSDTTIAFKKFLADVSPLGLVKRVRSDNGGEFTSNEFKNVLTDNFIRHEKSAPHSPHQNGTAESHWRTLFEMARCLLINANLPKSLWTYAVKASAYIRNRCFNRRLGKTAFEAMTHKKPNVSNMHTFGQTCFALIDNPKKLDPPRAEKGIFVGYDTGSPAYFIYFPNKETVKRVRCVNFHESKLKQDSVQTSNDNNDENDLIFVKQGMNDNSEQVYPNIITPSCEIDVEANVASPKSARSTDLNPTRPTPNQPAPSTSSSHVECDKRIRQRPKHLDDYFCGNEIDENINNVIHYCYNLNFDVPVSCDEAMSSPLAQKWENAMKSEMKALEESNTYDIVPLPKGRELV